MVNNMGKKQEQEEAESVQELSFLQMLNKEGWLLADVVGKMSIIPRIEDNLASFGFSDANGRKEIVLTATKEQWKTWLEAALKKIS